jgi:hypothetical protein
LCTESIHSVQIFIAFTSIVRKSDKFFQQKREKQKRNGFTNTRKQSVTASGVGVRRFGRILTEIFEETSGAT